QMKVIEELQRSMHISKAFNGHTIIPLSDYGMERLLREIESNDGEFVAYWNFKPYKFKLLQNESEWSFEQNKPPLEQSQVRIGIDIIWEIDQDAWNRYYKKFKEMYPKSISKLKEEIDSRR